MAASTPASEPENPHRLPWYVDYEEPRLIRNCDRVLIGTMDSPAAAELAVEAASAGDVDARRAVTRLTQTIEHYRHRGRMSPSERQHYLEETWEQSIQPERYYMDTREAPASALLTALENALAGRKHLGECAVDFEAEVEQAVAAFKASAPRWL
jgi:hypothetical protein